MIEAAAGKVISTILRHDSKVTSYKIALLRAINDMVLAYPDIQLHHLDVAVPLRLLAEFWMAYYWPFSDPQAPIMQGPVPKGKHDMSFRRSLMDLRRIWEDEVGDGRPSDGFFLINELRLKRRRSTYSAELLEAFDLALRDVSKALQQPIQYAGPGQWGVFDKPCLYRDIAGPVVAIPGTQAHDRCLVIAAALWTTFVRMSLWVEALCIHEWCLFTENVKQPDHGPVERGRVYSLLTDRPDNRRPLDWERNHVDVLMMEGREFICPWTAQRLPENAYELDHIIPLSIYPINELWNLVPSDRRANRLKSNRLPSTERLHHARAYLSQTYRNYELSEELQQALYEDVALRFSALNETGDLPMAIAGATSGFVEQMAESRNWERF